MGGILVVIHNFTFIVDYDNTNKVYNAICKEFPEVRVKDAHDKVMLVQMAYRELLNHFGSYGDATYSISYEKK